MGRKIKWLELITLAAREHHRATSEDGDAGGLGWILQQREWLRKVLVDRSRSAAAPYTRGACDSTAGEPAGSRSTARPSGDIQDGQEDGLWRRARFGDASSACRTTAKRHPLKGSLPKTSEYPAAAPAKQARRFSARGDGCGSKGGHPHQSDLDRHSRDTWPMNRVTIHASERVYASATIHACVHGRGRRASGHGFFAASTPLPDPATGKRICPKWRSAVSPRRLYPLGDHPAHSFKLLTDWLI